MPLVRLASIELTGLLNFAVKPRCLNKIMVSCNGAGAVAGAALCTVEFIQYILLTVVFYCWVVLQPRIVDYTFVYLQSCFVGTSL